MKKLILVVDDQADIRKLITLTLDYGAFEVHEASNGSTALRMVEALKPDLVLLDVMMPGELDGYAVCARIKADTQTHTPSVILLTARSQSADRAEGESVGCDAYLTKPFSPLQLIEIVELMLGAE